jgi:hypothetical protein
LRAQYIPLNLTNHVSILSDKIEKAATFERENNTVFEYSEDDIKPVISSDGIKLEDNVDNNMKIKSELMQLVK